MPAIFSLAEQYTLEMCNELVKKYHDDLDTTRATFDIVFALRDPEDESEKPVLSDKGHRVLGVSKIHSLKERILGLADAEIVLDGDAWPNLEIAVRRAVLDHQLQYFEVKRTKEGDFVYDDLQRPILKMRQTDRYFGWFDAVAERHREDSLEVIQMRRLFSESGQTYLPFVDPDTGVISNPPPLRATENVMQVSIRGAAPKPMTPGELIVSLKGENL